MPPSGQLSRRALLAGAAAAAALGGCARPSALLQSLGVGAPLHVHVVGLPSSSSLPLAQALRACGRAYEAAHRGVIALTVTSSAVPASTWFDCAHPPATCPPGAYPATAATGPNALDMVFGSAEGQIGANGVAQFLVRGRTRLRVQFGDGQLLAPRLASANGDLPDIIVAYDLWQYWLAPMAADVAAQWKTAADDTVGLTSALQRQARFFTQGQGTFAAAFPLLRSPMVVVNAPTAAPWDWPHLASAITGYRGRFPLQTGEFVQSPLYPDATELAAALAVAYGGAVGRATAASSRPAFGSDAVAAAVADLARIAAAGTTSDDGGFQPVYATYLWPPLAGVRNALIVPGAPHGVQFQPLPPGPVRSAVPCTYLCATVVAESPQRTHALDFASFLMNPAAQAQLVAADAGLLLRQPDALGQAARRYPWLAQPMADALASSDSDLVAAEVYGGDETPANATSYDGVADAFAAALAAAEADPANVAAVLQKAAVQ